MKELLIENVSNFNISPQLLQESIKTNEGRIVVKGIVQRANTKNGNGRVYPMEVLSREVQKYKDTFVKENRALGELDHSCFTEGYRILTKERGWVDFKNLDGTEQAATLNIQTKELEYQPIIEVINDPYSGDIINIESKTFQANVTPNHRFLITNQHDMKNQYDLKFKYASEICKGDLIPKKSMYLGGKTENVIIENERGKLEIPSNIFASFLGWWLAEGSVSRKGKNYCISIPQHIASSDNIVELDRIFGELSKITKNNYTRNLKKENEYCFYISDIVLATYLKGFGLCDKKYVPKEIKELDRETIQLFLDAYLSGDGSKQKNQEVYYTTSPQMSDDIAESINLTGFMSSVSDKEMAFEEYLVEGKWIKDFDWYTKKHKYIGKIIEDRKKHYTGRTLYSVRRKYSEYYHMSDCEITTTHYEGNIYCVSVPNKTILVMSPNGSTFWSGNSDAIINLKNVCHNIKDLWWDGDDVWAKIEVLTTPSGNILKELLLNGITVGISSRGMGSVKQLGETVEVQDDFELLCFDFVSTPSTQGAFMEVMKESLNYEHINEKLTNINDIITEILCNRAGFCSCDLPDNKTLV